MTEAQVYEGLTQIHDLLGDQGIALRPETTAADVEGWDSVANIDLVAAAQQRFGIRTSARVGASRQRRRARLADPRQARG